MELNFNELKRATMKITLADEAQTVLHIKVPTKHIFDEFKNAKNGNQDEYYRLSYTLLNHNVENKTFTQDEIEKMFDYQDVVMLVVSYTQFMREIGNQKN